MNDIIYMDNAATTRVYPEVVEAMEPYWREYYGNPASIYQFSQKNQIALSKSRELIGNSIHAANANEIYFTGGGSEGNNWILKGIAFALKEKGESYYYKQDRASFCALCLSFFGENRIRGNVS